MANCPRCGAQMDNGARFCGECGFDAAQAASNQSNNNNAYQGGNNSYSAYQQPQNNSYSSYQQNNQYSQNNGYTQYQPSAPQATLPNNRSLLKMILLSLVTFGIYPLVWWTVLTDNVNLICDRHDGKHSTHYLLMCFVFSWLTCGIGNIVWIHNLSERIGVELRRRGIRYDFGAGTFWLWNVLGSLIFVGPFVYLHKLCTAMNLLADSYNYYG